MINVYSTPYVGFDYLHRYSGFDLNCQLSNVAMHSLTSRDRIDDGDWNICEMTDGPFPSANERTANACSIDNYKQSADDGKATDACGVYLIIWYLLCVFCNIRLLPAKQRICASIVYWMQNAISSFTSSV